MAELNLDIGYPSHLKTRLLVAKLGRGAEALPIRLWCYAAQHYARDGKLPGHDARAIEVALDWAGEPGAAVAALVETRFLDEKNGVYKIHNWAKRQGHLHAFSVRAKRAADARWDKIRRGKKDDAQASPKQCSNQPTKSQTNERTPRNPPTANGNGADAAPPAPLGVGGLGVNGNGAGGGGDTRAGNLPVKRVFAGLNKPSDGDDIDRQGELRPVLVDAGVSEDMIPKLLQRRDITAARVTKMVSQLRNDPKIDDVAAVLVYRLGGARS